MSKLQIIQPNVWVNNDHKLKSPASACKFQANQGSSIFSSYNIYFLVLSECSCKVVSHFYVFTACQVRFGREAAKSTGEINMLLNDLSFTATSTCHFSSQFDCSLTLKNSKDITCRFLTPLSFCVYKWKAERQRKRGVRETMSEVT